MNRTASFVCIMVCGFTMLSGRAYSSPPNVVLIFTDDQGYHDVGCYGSEIQTPNIDSIATQGIRFTQWYSASSICTPSRYGLLTGRNPSRSQDALLDALMFLSNEHRTRGIHASEKTIATILTDTGYETALIGKWHLGHGSSTFLPTRHGFAGFFGHTGGCVDFYTMRYGNTPDWYRNEELVDVTGYATDVITDEAIKFLGHDRDRPFFLFLSYNAPHFGKGWNDGEAKPVNQLQPPPADLARVAHIEDITRRKYAAKVVNLDDAIGRVLKTLDARELANTLVIFLTDHGGDPRYGGANQPFRGQKATLFEGGIRIPCIMRWPEKIKPGTVSNAVVSSLDLVPTLCQLCDANTPPILDGKDISALFDGNRSADDDQRTLFWELGQHQELKRGTWSAIREGKWKFVRDDLGKAYLFDMSEDPFESQDLSVSHPKIFKLLAARANQLADEYRRLD